MHQVGMEKNRNLYRLEPDFVPLYPVKATWSGSPRARSSSRIRHGYIPCRREAIQTLYLSDCKNFGFGIIYV